MNHIRWGAAAGAALAALAVASGCAPAAPGDDGDTSQIRIAGPSFSIPSFDPFNFAHTWLPAGNAVYDALVVIDGEGEQPEPWLAESWEVSDDERTVTFQLREDVDFVDGTHLDAAGLETYLDALFANDGYVWKATMDLYGNEATATDEYTLEISTANSPIDLDWWWVLSITAIASPATVGVEGAFDDGPVGSGPYVIDELNADVSVSFVRNPDAWSSDLFPYDSVLIQAYSDPVAILNAVKSGQMDIGAVDVTYAREAETSGLRVTEGPGDVPLIYIADHNGELVPALGDVRVRQAMAYAFDREAILENMNLGYGDATSQAYIEIQPEYVDGGDDRYAYDLDRARELMAEAGYADGFDVTVPTFPGTAFFGTQNLEPIVQTTLAEIGIRVTYEAIGGDQGQYHENTVRTNAYPMYLFNMPIPNVTTSFEEVWGPTGVPEFDQLLATRLQGNAEEREEAYRAIGEFLLDEAWYIVLGSRATVFVSDPTVQVEIKGTYSMPKLYEYTPAG